jgi:hypothetical protein
MTLASRGLVKNKSGGVLIVVEDKAGCACMQVRRGVFSLATFRIQVAFAWYVAF